MGVCDGHQLRSVQSALGCRSYSSGHIACAVRDDNKYVQHRNVAVTTTKKSLARIVSPVQRAIGHRPAAATFASRSAALKNGLRISSATGRADIEQLEIGKFSGIARVIAKRLDEALATSVRRHCQCSKRSAICALNNQMAGIKLLRFDQTQVRLN